MAYFDNAATTYPKPDRVYSFMDDFYRNCGGSAGRGEYAIASSVKAMVDETRYLVMDILHCPSKQVIFTPTATIALNIIIQGIISKGIRNIYISPFEHNAVTRTLKHFEGTGKIKVATLPVTKDLNYDFAKTKYMFESVRPEFVIVSHASNVIGLISPVEQIFALAKKHNAVTLVDMAQTAGLVDLNVGLETIDFAVFAGHKTLMGPTGISGFIINPTFDLPSTIFGGTGFDSANQDMPESLPEKFEMGTLNTLGIAGLNAALKWIKEQSVSAIYNEEVSLRKRLINILSAHDYLTIVGNVPEQKYVGIVSCLMDGISSDSAGGVFSERGIAVRTGLQCAPLAHQLLGTYPAGTIRFSVNSLTTDADFDALETALSSIDDEF